jgi:hypothetical protein
MQQLIDRLIQRARDQQVVLCQPLKGELQLLVYPLEDGVLLALGFGRHATARVDAEAVLRRRSAEPARFGAWLPAMLSDGSWYVLRRLAEEGPARRVTAPPAEQLQAAEELLA